MTVLCEYCRKAPVAHVVEYHLRTGYSKTHLALCKPCHKRAGYFPAGHVCSKALTGTDGQTGTQMNLTCDIAHCTQRATHGIQVNCLGWGAVSCYLVCEEHKTSETRTSTSGKMEAKIAPLDSQDGRRILARIVQIEFAGGVMVVDSAP